MERNYGCLFQGKQVYVSTSSSAECIHSTMYVTGSESNGGDGYREVDITIRTRNGCDGNHPKIVPEVTQGCCFVTLDLKSGYYHLKIREEFQKLLGIQWKLADGLVKTWQWRVSSLGIASLVWKFTKMLIAKKVYLHLKGIPNFVFIDDIMVLGRSEDKCRHNLAMAKWLHQFIYQRRSYVPSWKRLILRWSRKRLKLESWLAFMDRWSHC